MQRDDVYSAKGFVFLSMRLQEVRYLSLNLQHMYVKMSINLLKYNYKENVGKNGSLLGIMSLLYDPFCVFYQLDKAQEYKTH